jgi:hypothetical protein
MDEMEVKIYLWQSTLGTWFIVFENSANQFLHMQPLCNATTVAALQRRGVPTKEFS